LLGLVSLQVWKRTGGKVPRRAASRRVEESLDELLFAIIDGQAERNRYQMTLPPALGRPTRRA
jgi:hypothetical protein